MMACIEVAANHVSGAEFRFVRHNAANETVLCRPEDEHATVDRLAERSARFGARLESATPAVRIVL